MSIELPPLPRRGQPEWYDDRTDWDTAVADLLKAVVDTQGLVDAEVTVTEGAQWDASLALTNGILQLGLTVPPGAEAWPRGDLPPDTDWNSLRTPGIYRLVSGSTGQLNAPPWIGGGNVLGFGVVYNASGSPWVAQEVYRYGGRPERWCRIQNGTNSFGRWTLLKMGTILLPAGQDFDTLVEDGDYAIVDATHANSMFNVPGGLTGNDAIGYVRVIRFGQGAGEARVIQRAFTMSGREFHRSGMSDTISGPWTERTNSGGGGGGAASDGAGLRSAVLIEDFTRRVAVSTNGKPAIALRFDHGLTNFASIIRPLLVARNLPCSIAMNSRTWDDPQNSGVTPSQADAWDDTEWLNHSATHKDATTLAAMEDEIVNGLEELKAQLPSHRIDGFAIPGISAEQYDGFGTGGVLMNFSDHPAGRLMLSHHAYTTGYVYNSLFRPLDGVVRQGQRHLTFESIPVSETIDNIDQAVAEGKGIALMMHPRTLNMSGRLSTADLTQVLDHIAGLRDAGTAVVLTLGQLTAARYW